MADKVMRPAVVGLLLVACGFPALATANIDQRMVDDAIKHRLQEIYQHSGPNDFHAFQRPPRQADYVDDAAPAVVLEPPLKAARPPCGSARRCGASATSSTSRHRGNGT